MLPNRPNIARKDCTMYRTFDQSTDVLLCTQYSVQLHCSLKLTNQDSTKDCRFKKIEWRKKNNNQLS